MEYLSEKVIHQPEVNDREGARHAKVVRERETDRDRETEGNTSRHKGKSSYKANT